MLILGMADQGVVSSAFSPTDIAGLKLWLDADDATTITLNGSNVSQWDDKSANGYDFTEAIASLQPARTLSGQNGKTVLTFAGDNLLNASLDWGASASTLFIVGEEDNVAGSGFQNIFTTGTGVAGQWGYGIEAGTGAPGNRLAIFDIGQSNQTFSSRMTNTNADILCFTSAGISSGSVTANLYFNGSADASNPVTITSTTSATGGRLGSDFNLAEPYQGTICEIIMYDTQLGTTDRNNVENYLKTKWATT